MPESLPTAPRRSPVAPDVDVSGRALHLRDVDIGAFLHPKTIALIGASDQSAKPNTAMTRKFAQWSQQNMRASFSSPWPMMRMPQCSQVGASLWMAHSKLSNV